jgi:ABC-2 type transport system ATP-binding protein
LGAIVSIQSVSHSYGQRVALEDVSFSVEEGACFGLLGPNGGGKTTLFRVLTTLLTPTRGTASLCGFDVVRERADVRGRIGVVFQSPSLDAYLTVRENLRHAGHLYGLSGRPLETRIDETLERLEVSDRAGELVRTLSGGLKRRVEIAKSLLHRPVVLLLDEPSTGLDPSARKNMWQQLSRLRGEDRVSIVLTTHFMDEADRCDALAVLDLGRLVALGSPDELKGRIGVDCITIACDNAADMSARIGSAFACPTQVIDGTVRIAQAGGAALVPRLAERFGREIQTITVGKPTLEDVFVHVTGHRFDVEGQEGRA